MDKVRNNTVATGIVLGVVLALASLTLFISHVGATVDRIFKCPDGSDGPPCGGPPSDRIFKCPDGSDGPPCGPPERAIPEN